MVVIQLCLHTVNITYLCSRNKKVFPPLHYIFNAKNYKSVKYSNRTTVKLLIVTIYVVKKTLAILNHGSNPPV